MNIFELLFYQPLYNVVIIFYHFLGDNLGLAIIAIAIVSRTILIPISLRQIKMAESSREFNEKAKKIREKYKKDKEKQTEELLRLQQEYLPAQLGGCLPLILQFIIFINIYTIIRNLISEGASSFNNIAYSFVEKITGEVDTMFFTILDLKISPSSAEENVLFYLILIILVGITQYFSLKIFSGIRNKQNVVKEEKKSKKHKNQSEDFSEIMKRTTNQVMVVFPFLLMFISYGLPAGLSIYLITTSLFVILQQVVFYKLKLNN